jgi:H+/gluconate symporter-like permease
VSLFVVVFAVYPFAAELYRQSNIPKRLMPGAIALGAFSFTMDTLPGTPQIQNIIPTTFFKTTGWAAPWLGVIGSIATLAPAWPSSSGAAAARWRRARAMRARPQQRRPTAAAAVPRRRHADAHPLLSLAPLVLVGVANLR